MAYPSPILRRALALAALSLAVVPALAQADVTRSSVTSPATPTYRLHQPERTLDEQTLTVVATTNGAAPDEVDVLCTYGSEWSVVAEEARVGAGGRLELDVELAGFPIELCDLRVVPSGYRGPDFSPFTGPAVAASTYEPEYYSVPVRDTKRIATLDYHVETGHQRGAAGILSAGSSGLSAHLGIRAGAHEPFAYRTWDEGAEVLDLEVDGRTAYTAAEIPLFNFGGDTAKAPAGFEGVQSSVALDPATGAVTVSESQRIMRCEVEAPGRPMEENCRNVLDTGLRLERTISLTREHSVADVRDRWVSSDGAAHQVLALYSSMASAAKAAVVEWDWRFPGDTAFKPYTGDVTPQAPGTVLARERTGLGAPGALSFDPAPRGFSFGDDASLSETVQLAVPAGGVAPLRRVFAVGRDVEEAAALGRATEDGFEAPRIAISSPTSTRAAALAVAGRATDNVGVAALSVNGRPVAVGPDGSFSVPVALARGTNDIAVVATDAAGLTATARVAVQRGDVRRCRVPKVRAGARVKAARAAIRKAGCRPGTRRVRSRKVRKGRVVGLSRKAGTVVPLGTAVRIRVSRGR